jgi:membrane-associated phospholipid phosphatase
MSLLNWLDHIDKVLVLLIQHDSDHFLFDKVMPVLRDPFTWIPLYAFMLYYAIRKGRKKAWFFIVLSVGTFAITDSVTTQLLKPLFGRLRPCCDPELHSLVRVIVDCGGIYSMPSSHAANHFGLAAFWYFTILTMTGRKWKWLWVWAAVICYAQIYVGKHYPSDILFGSFIGCITGMGMSRLFEYWWNRQAGRGVLLSMPATSPG